MRMDGNLRQCLTWYRPHVTAMMAMTTAQRRLAPPFLACLAFPGSAPSNPHSVYDENLSKRYKEKLLPKSLN